MATYSCINNLEFKVRFKGTKIPKEEWEGLVNKKLRMTFLTSVIDFDPKYNKAGYVTKVSAEYSGADDSALYLPDELRDMKRFLDGHGVK